MEIPDGLAVGRLHADHIEHSFMSGLGPEFLGVLYECLLRTGFGFGYVIRDEDRVAGFIFGRLLPSPSMLSLVRKSWRRLLIPLIQLPVRHPIALVLTLIGMRQSDQVVSEPGVGEWLASAVAPEARGSEASRRIVGLLFERLRNEGCALARGAFHCENMAARKYLEKHGCRIIKETRIRGRRICWIEKELTS